MQKFIAFFVTGFLAAVPASGDHRITDSIRLPDGFEISVFAEVPNARTLVADHETGIVYVGSRRGHIYSVRDTDGDGVADEINRRADGLHVPNGIAISDGRFFVGLQDRMVVTGLSDGDSHSEKLRGFTTIYDDFYDQRHHGWRYIGAGPDGKLYVSLGVPCNICQVTENTGKIIRMDPDGSNAEVVADGVRNSVGFDWNPVTGEFWFTDNGADGMGDDTPPDELNRVSSVGQHFGFPYFGGRDTPLFNWEHRVPPVPVVPAEIEFQAHVAALGIDFYTGGMFPDEYRNDAFVAQRGSWNRSVPIGYRIMRIRFDDDGNATGKEIFADGWLQGTRKLGRIADIEELADGSLLVSDDTANLIYRISYSE